MQGREGISQRFGPMACAALQASTIDAWTARVAPGDVFRHPRVKLARHRRDGLFRASRRPSLVLHSACKSLIRLNRQGGVLQLRHV